MSGSGPGSTPDETGPEADRQAPTSVNGAYPDDRRRTPRFVVDQPCTVFTGRHVWDGHLRDVSEGGAMLRGVPGLVAEDLLLVRLMRLPDVAFRARVRGVSLLGAHIAIEEPSEVEAWRRAIAELAT
ncbi:PilZ domain-containing protein [Neoroseomonas oryzicola]|uniref:PilZ domain-containing protein n=1 Tax=Neoroseomonas oryzicola TaxID=535904 RepID=A0A9X9WGS0_9PROT|nr:PilZ domain-containing protein [Neoroseomonas oryzicola]MBR0659530.1 PilZ domain-containing protein [Neoroseomonas oryzicola]NKE16191.1 PilZ domain-containing protein [Neoroseomonas oryzicola]